LAEKNKIPPVGSLADSSSAGEFSFGGGFPEKEYWVQLQADSVSTGGGKKDAEIDAKFAVNFINFADKG